MASPLFATKPVDRLVADTESESGQLKRAVGLLDLTALGIGAIIGTGIFVILGEAIGEKTLGKYLHAIILGVILLSILPGIIEVVRERRRIARERERGERGAASIEQRATSVEQRASSNEHE